MYTSSVSGIQAANLLLSASAHRVANVNTEGSDVDLAEEAVEQIKGSTAHAANVSALRTQARTDRSLLDILA